MKSKFFKTFFSIEVMTVLMFFMALACAVATFVENDYGTLGAKSFIYGQTWFEAIMTLLTLGVVVNIIWFKMYTYKKFFLLMIHGSLIFIFVGAGLTRYAGYEGVMTIPENAMQNLMASNDEYIQGKLFKDDKEIHNFEIPVLMTQLNQTHFNETYHVNEETFSLRFDKFIQNASEKIVRDPKGQPLINLIITNMGGAKSQDLQDNEVIESKYATFSLGKPIKEQNKPYVVFKVRSNKMYITSNVQIHWSTMDGKHKGSAKLGEEELLRSTRIYRVGQARFVTPEFTARGKIDVVSDPSMKKSDQVNAVIATVTHNKQTYKMPLFGKGGSYKGYRRNLQIGDYKLELQWGSKNIKLPFTLLLDDFKLTRYPGSNSPSEYSSDVKVYDKDLEEPLAVTISMNNTLDYKGFRFFQSSYKMDESATILSVNKDPGKVPTYIGYFFLFAGLILSLFTKNGRFQKLAKKRYTLENVKSNYLKNLGLLFVLLLAFQSPTFAQDGLSKIQNIDKEHAKYFGQILVQDYQGRIKPLNSLAIEVSNKVSRTNELFGLNENQMFISMLVYPRFWQTLNIVKISDPNVKKLLGVKKEQKRFAFSDIYDKNDNYKLEVALEEANAKKPASRNTFDKDLIKIDERLNVAYNVFSGAFLKFFPKQNDNNNKWLDPTAAVGVINGVSTTISQKEAQHILKLMDGYFIALKNAMENKGSWEEANKAVDLIVHYQKKHGQSVYLSNWKIQAELFFNKANIFDRLTPLYLFAGLVLLFSVFFKIFKPTLNIQGITKIVLILFAIGFIIHTAGLGLRWYVAGHAPWSNGYESMIYIAWAIILSGVYFARQSTLALSTTGILSGITLFVAHLSWMEPQITTLTPVLKSYWLTIHVSVITASYGFLGLSALLGFISLIFYIIINPKKHNEQFFSLIMSIKESRRINEMSMLIGLVLLVIGNFLGGIWANESWGRYWGWDPKETWTLVSILIYAIILHLHYIKGLASNYIFATLSLISYSCIIMTYFGVNYYLAGMHSYAAGDPLPIPTFVPVSAAIIAIVIALSFRNRKII